MKIFFFIIQISMLLLLACCCSLPVDDSVSWVNNNRYGLEMKLQCNNKTLWKKGIIGCTLNENDNFKNVILTFPKLYEGKIKIFYNGTEAGNTYTIDENEALSLSLADIAGLRSKLFGEKDPLLGKNYQIEIQRKVTIGKQDFVGSIIGRAFFKVLPDNPYIESLNFSVGNENFNGVGWYQKRYNELPIELTISPTGTNGSLLYKQDEGTNDNFEKYSFTQSPFDFQITEGLSTAYTLSAVAKDYAPVERATFLYIEETAQTADVSTPSVTIKKKWFKDRITFEFKDKNSDGEYVVIGVEINGEVFKKTNKGTVTNSKSSYVVKGVTLLGRTFVGTYYPDTDTWGVL